MNAGPQVIIARNPDGSVNEEATVVAFRTALRVLIAKSETEAAQISEHATAIFDAMPGARITKSAVVGMILPKLNPTVETYNALKEAVENFLTAHTGEKGSAVYGIAKGRSGGMCRWSDVKDPAPTTPPTTPAQ